MSFADYSGCLGRETEAELRSFAKNLDNLRSVREAIATGLLRIDQFAVGADLEDSLVTLDE